ncbi:hypothetical protein HOI18_02800 [Candidatus Uhrbacteria bacterium]|jgi:hypothetical protein|nr:hypothetical protein [Candidatus Uhrbacteria bacterium]
MSEGQAGHAVVAEASWGRDDYKCGHTGPVQYAHEIFGVTYRLQEGIIRSREECAQCRLDKAVDGITQCACCNTAIFKGQECMNYGYGLCCMSRGCGVGPIGAQVGIWNGSGFVDGILAGTVTVVKVPAGGFS